MRVTDARDEDDGALCFFLEDFICDSFGWVQTAI